MPIHLASFIFEGRARGWEETHYFNSSNGLHEATMNEAKKVAHARKEMLGVECFIKAIRVSTFDAEHEGFMSEQVMRPSGELDDRGLPLGQSAAMPDVCLLVRLYDALKRKSRAVYLRGIWDVISDKHGEYVGKDRKDWQHVLFAWWKVIGRNNWGWMSRVNPVKKALTGVAADAGGVVTFTFGAGMFAGIDAGTRKQVAISGVNNGNSILNREHVLVVQSATTATSLEPLALGVSNVGGFGRYSAVEFKAYDFIVDQRITTRETGAPLLESPGRSKKRPKA